MEKSFYNLLRKIKCKIDCTVQVVRNEMIKKGVREEMR